MIVQPAASHGDSSVLQPLADIIEWSATAIDVARLGRARIDARPFIPFVAPASRWFYWELHFSGKEPVRADFLHRPSLRPAAGESEFSPPDPILERLIRWYGTGDTARHCHDTAWLEIDEPLAQAANVRQGVSICLEPDIGNRQRDVPRRSAALDSVVDTFARLRSACDLEPSGAEVLARVHGALGQVDGSLRHLSIMRGRPGSPSKVYAVLPHGRLGEFLKAAAWPGATDDALKLADLACAESEAINVDLSFDDALMPRIAYEQFFDPSPNRDPLRRGATSLAKSFGLLTHAQAEALERWVGAFRVGSRRNAVETKVMRWFDTKFVLSPEGLEFKAYLGFHVRPD
jgi:hypothetical protein